MEKSYSKKLFRLMLVIAMMVTAFIATSMSASASYRAGSLTAQTELAAYTDSSETALAALSDGSETAFAVLYTDGSMVFYNRAISAVPGGERRITVKL